MGPELPAKQPAPAPKAKLKEKKSEWEAFQNQDDFEGGFLRDDGPPEPRSPRADLIHTHDDEEMGGGFFPASQEEPEHGDLTIDHGEKSLKSWPREITQIGKFGSRAYLLSICLGKAMRTEGRSHTRRRAR